MSSSLCKPEFGAMLSSLLTASFVQEAVQGIRTKVGLTFFSVSRFTGCNLLAEANWMQDEKDAF